MRIVHTASDLGGHTGTRLALPHSSTDLTRGLEREEQVLLVDPDGRARAAIVTDVTFTLTDTRYEVALGIGDRRTHELLTGPVSTADVVGLLHTLAAAGRDEEPVESLALVG